ncbi:hypothetical protein H1R20_g4973, partial [Candolleomyces eurysporus]
MVIQQEAFYQDACSINCNPHVEERRPSAAHRVTINSELPDDVSLLASTSFGFIKERQTGIVSLLRLVMHYRISDVSATNIYTFPSEILPLSFLLFHASKPEEEGTDCATAKLGSQWFAPASRFQVSAALEFHRKVQITLLSLSSPHHIVALVKAMDDCLGHPTDPDELEQLENWASPKDWEPPDDWDFRQHWELPDDWIPPEEWEPADEWEETGWCNDPCEYRREDAVDSWQEYPADSEEFEHQALSEDLEPPEDWEFPLTWQPADDWEPAEDWEAPEDWAEIALCYLNPSSLPIIWKSQLIKSPDWAARWIPFFSNFIPSEPRIRNIATLLSELMSCPDTGGILKIVRREVALSWTPSVDKPGYYFRRDPKSGTIDFGMMHSAQVVYISGHEILNNYQLKCRKFLARGKPLVQDIITCFDDIRLVEKTWRAISLREGMGMPTRVPAHVGRDWLVEELELNFGVNPPIDPDIFYSNLKQHIRRKKSYASSMRRGDSWV